MNNRYNDNYSELLKIVNYIQETYNYDMFNILAIHTNKSFDNTNNIINYTIRVPDKFLSDDESTHTFETYSEYRQVLKNLMKDLFRL